jgi:chromosomal replication initiation ATPase DnaA
VSLIHTVGARSAAPSSTRDECIAKLKAARARMTRPVLPAPSAQAILSLRDGAPGPSVVQLIAIVAQAHRISPERLKAHCRERPITRARKHLVYLVFRERPLLSSVQIGRLIGGFDHSTILHARDTFGKVAPLMQAEIQKAEEALVQLQAKSPEEWRK